MMTEYEIWFAGVRGISGRKKYALRKQVSSAEELFYMEETDFMNTGMSRKEWDILYSQKTGQQLKEAGRCAEEMKQKGIRLLTRTDSSYPLRLRDISSPPYALYLKGALLPAKKPYIAIVGARACTSYGRKYAAEFAGASAGAGAGIISGMALGIDGAAQRGALDAGGYTAAVLGCGPDICYPREHIGLYEDILEKGGTILSEYPPGTPPRPQNFPARNRIISGLSDILLVMEAREKSGSLITADCALEQGKDVYALPGPVDSLLSVGCNELIRQGAGILTTPENLLGELPGVKQILYQKTSDEKIMLESRENMVYSCLRLNPKSLQQLSEETKIPVAELLGILISMELNGVIEEVSKNYYRKVE